MARGTPFTSRRRTTTGAPAPKFFVKPYLFHVEHFFQAQKNPPKRVQVGMIFAYGENTSQAIPASRIKSAVTE